KHCTQRPAIIDSMFRLFDGCIGHPTCGRLGQGGVFPMIAGMDFGTTNSGMAVYDGRALRLLPLDRANENPRVLRTALYVTNDQEVVIGREALNEFFNRNVGRPVKLERVWVGEIEVRGADMFFIRDVYVWVDVMSPGRLFLSFKTNLRDHD